MREREGDREREWEGAKRRGTERNGCKREQRGLRERGEQKERGVRKREEDNERGTQKGGLKKRRDEREGGG